MIMADIE